MAIITDIVAPTDDDPYGSYRLDKLVTIVGQPRPLPRPLLDNRTGEPTERTIVDERPAQTNIRSYSSYLRRRVELVLDNGTTVYGCTMCDRWGLHKQWGSTHNRVEHPESKKQLAWAERYQPKGTTRAAEDPKPRRDPIAAFLDEHPTPHALTVGEMMEAYRLLATARTRIASLSDGNHILGVQLIECRTRLARYRAAVRMLRDPDND